MKLYHVTSAFVAQRLLSSLQFSTTIKQEHRSPNDASGLSGYTFRQGYFFDQETANRGVKLVLKWHGHVEKRSPFTRKTYVSDVLYIEHPWRCFINSTTRANNLQIIGLLDDKSQQLALQLGLNLAQGWLAEDEYRVYVKRKSQAYLSKYWKTCSRTPHYLSVRDNQSESVNTVVDAASAKQVDSLHSAVANAKIPRLSRHADAFHVYATKQSTERLFDPKQVFSSSISTRLKN